MEPLLNYMNVGAYSCMYSRWLKQIRIYSNNNMHVTATAWNVHVHVCSYKCRFWDIWPAVIGARTIIADAR